ncbi:uncharacterized protein LOC142328432 isoform X2 [Lycorma delicatula]|uniref:uncharacterized protein LOC142328432 isoform X2 n=1 Tax=Lycorma delicatula TaxID=130591 RepID=UPI003F519B78
MESRIGLDYIVENPDYTIKLAAALDTSNVTVKKQVFELLSALCVYNAEGYARALDALEHYKELKSERYRFKVVVTELQQATAEDYQTALVAFINCLIISTPQLHDRIRVRNEFIGLKLLPILNELRRSAAGLQDLSVQLDVFDEQRESDDAQILQAPHGVDLNSHLDVFYAILRQVAETPQEIPFLVILQHLLRIDPREAISDIVWDTAERLVHRATLLEGREDAMRLLRSPSLQAKQHPLCGSRKQSLNTTPTAPLPPPPPPPLAPPQPPAAPPPPPPAPAMGGPPPPPLLTPPTAPVSAPEPPEVTNVKLLPQQETPTPRTKMKTINWNKIPNNKVVGKHNIWSLVARSHQHSPMADLDWDEMEGLFCQQAPPAAAAPIPISPKLSGDPDRRRKEPSEIALLDGKRSLNVNIFLKQFRSSNEDIIQVIRDGEHDEIGAEKLRGLLKILPELDELEMLRTYDGDKSKLGNAEKFLLQLIDIPNYKLRIESMLLKEEFAANMNYLEPSINAMIVAGEDLMTNKPLQEVLYMVLVAGNFLNSGGYAGNAAGVKLSSLQKLTDIRANKPGMNLIHYVALQAEKKRKDLLRFPDDMLVLEEATKTTVEQLQNEINTLDTRIKKIHKQIDLPTTENEIKLQMGEFLKMAEHEVGNLHRDMTELENVRKSLAEFFCEDVGTFKLEECFRVFHGFCVKFRQAVVENERRRVQEEQAAARRKQREEQLAAKRRHLSGQLGSNGSESDCNLVDSLLYDIRSGFPQKKSFDKDTKVRKLGNGAMTSEEDISQTGSPMLTRRRFGSFSGEPGAKEENYSPDVTPTGSLRRRRSRVPSEEDDTVLMDFLRGHDGTRERKSWGSLDRSWARRARGGGRKRPDLLSAEFGERERPSSPSPAPSPSSENKPLLFTSSEEETKPRAWKQKIEAWLQGNEKEERQTEELRRKARRVQSNRRSLEADSESEGRGTLDTLPEGSQYKRVYPDWKPTIEKTDVVGAMEAIAAQPQNGVKDKAPWRKSNLNVSNSTEETEMDMRRLRRIKSRGSMDNSVLQAITEEEKRKGMIETLGKSLSPDESLTVYLRRPSDDSGSTAAPAGYRSRVSRTSPLLGRKVLPSNDQNNEKQDEQVLPPFIPRRTKKVQETGVTDRVEIDSDNIETPPATRKLVGIKPRKIDVQDNDDDLSVRLKSHNEGEDEEILGDGQFDRFSSARRTRRYRKAADEEPQKKQEIITSPEVVPEKQVIRSPTLQAQSYPVETLAPQDTESRLKRWQDRLKYRGNETSVEEEAIANIAKAGEELQNLGHSATLPRSRHRTGIARRDVIEAFRQLRDGAEDSSLLQSNKNKEEDKQKSRAMEIGSSFTLPRSSRYKNNAEQSPNLAVRKYGIQQDTPVVIDPNISSNSTTKLNNKDRDDNQTVRNSPTTLQNQDVRSKNTSQVKNEFIPEIKVHAMTPAKQKSDHIELHDEGFEETQSLVSETPSQGTSSGCNYEGDSVDSPTMKKEKKEISRLDSSGSGDTNYETSKKPVRSSSVRLPERKSIIPRSSGSLRKTDSQASLIRQNNTDKLKRTTRSAENSPLQRTRVPTSTSKLTSKSSDAPKKVPSTDRLLVRTALKRSDSKSMLKRPSSLDKSNSRLSANSKTSPSNNLMQPRKRVERSNSRSSLRSSRSSLNSSTSISTVRNVRPVSGLSNYTNAIKSLTSDLKKNVPVVKKPLAPVQLKSKNSVPASRSSSSGSSIGPTVRRPKVTTGVSTSFKENSGSVPASRSSSSGSSIGPTRRTGQGFMRPTASSAAKDSVDAPRVRSTLRQPMK